MGLMQSLWQLQRLYRLAAWATALAVLLNALAMHPPLMQFGSQHVIDAGHLNGSDAGDGKDTIGHDALHEDHAHGTIVSERNQITASDRPRFTSITAIFPESTPPTLKRPPRSARS